MTGSINAEGASPAPLGGKVGIRTFSVGMAAFLRGEALILAVVVGTFITRFLLAGWNSYWLDELYSVAIYGVWNDSAAEAVATLARTSVHPPLYQFVLYNWMDWFGDTETATRTLSNLYVSLAVLFLYLALREFLSRRVAVTSAVGLALMYSTMYYGMETRSYAQSIMLVTLSSYLLLSLLRRGADRGWGTAVVSWRCAAFLATNTAVLLTHYYNVFFFGAQALMVLVFVLREFPARRWLRVTGLVSILFLIPVGLFLAVWGRTAFDTVNRAAGGFAIEGASSLRGPLDLFRGAILRDNISAPRGLLWVGAGLGVFLLTRVVGSLVRRSDLNERRMGDWTRLYLLGWSLVPLALVYVVFLVTGFARYSNRYFLFSVVPLAPLIVLSIEEVWGQVNARLCRPFSNGWLAVLYIPLFITAILPGTVGASDLNKADWRGNAEEIVNIVHSNPDSKYVVFETSFRQTPILDYYLARFSDDVRVASTIRRHQDNSGGPFSFESDQSLLEGSDYLIVPFIHHRISNFPNALARLEEIYRIQLWQIDEDGRGLVIFATGDEH